ncbi:hypothetical protein KEM56_003944 [Ascosphaera pollenicola]|nr:hypothetical protein KEM56_003944 [Ascosphaera pollenicola]
MFSWLFDISTFIAVISIIALTIAYEQMAQINKKGEMAQMEAQLADERAAASERDARLTRENVDLQAPSIPETDSSASVNMTKMKTALAKKYRQFNQKIKFADIKARAFSPKNILRD